MKGVISDINYINDDYVMFLWQHYWLWYVTDDIKGVISDISDIKSVSSDIIDLKGGCVMFLWQHKWLWYVTDDIKGVISDISVIIGVLVTSMTSKVSVQYVYDNTIDFDMSLLTSPNQLCDVPLNRQLIWWCH